MGIKSSGFNVFLQFSQYDLPRIDSFRGKRSIKTFKKDPTQRPIKKNKSTDKW